MREGGRVRIRVSEDQPISLRIFFLSLSKPHTYLLDKGVLLGGSRGGATSDGLQAEGEVVLLLHHTGSGRHAGRRLGGGKGQGLSSRGTILCLFW